MRTKNRHILRVPVGELWLPTHKEMHFYRYTRAKFSLLDMAIPGAPERQLLQLSYSSLDRVWHVKNISVLCPKIDESEMRQLQEEFEC